MSQVKFMLHSIARGNKRARVRYSLANHTSGRPAVWLHPKDFEEGEKLSEIFPSEYSNRTDSHSDFFDKGRVLIFKGHPLYRQAHAAALDAEWRARSHRRQSTKRTTTRTSR